MPFGSGVGRLILLRQQLKSKKPKLCPRCFNPYDPELVNCPHCIGLSEREVEELIEKNKKAQYTTIYYIVFLFICLSLLFAIMTWIL